MAVHTIFVYHNANGDDKMNSSSAGNNLQLLDFLARNINRINKLGVRLVVWDVSDTDLQNPELVSMMQTEGINSFPALKTQRGLYMGVDGIIKVYSENLKQQGNVEELEREGDEVLRDYYDEELINADIDEKDDDGDEDAKDMMSKYSEEIARRMGDSGSKPGDKISSMSSRKKPPPKWARRIVDGGKGNNSRGRDLPAHVAQPSRPDNVMTDDDDMDVVLKSIRDTGEDEDAEDIKMSEKFWENTKVTRV